MRIMILHLNMFAIGMNEKILCNEEPNLVVTRKTAADQSTEEIATQQEVNTVKLFPIKRNKVLSMMMVQPWKKPKLNTKYILLSPLTGRIEACTNVVPMQGT